MQNEDLRWKKLWSCAGGIFVIVMAIGNTNMGSRLRRWTILGGRSGLTCTARSLKTDLSKNWWWNEAILTGFTVA